MIWRAGLTTNTRSPGSGGGFSDPFGVAVDGSGNVYIAAYNSNNNEAILYKDSPANGTYTQITILTNLFDHSGLAADGFGNLYVALQG